MKHLPNDIKSVKKRLRAWHVFVRVIRCAIITTTILCFLCFIGFIVLSVLAVGSLPSHWGDGRNPLPPAAPQLKFARMDCIHDVREIIRRRVIFSERRGNNTYDYTYRYSDIEVAIVQEYDFCPYYAFYGRVRLTKPDLPPDHPLKDAVFPVRQTDFFLVNRFNPAEAKHYRGNYYFPEHYDLKHAKFGFDPPQTESKRNVSASSGIGSSWFGR